MVWRIGVWEQREGLYQLAVRLVGDRGLVVAGEHPDQLEGEEYELLVVSPWAVGWAGRAALVCRTVLLPGCAGPLTWAVQAQRAVSYGLNPRDTLTVSSLEGERICVALQRGLLRPDGGAVDEQELVLAYGGEPPELVLARTGLRLLLGGPGEWV